MKVLDLFSGIGGFSLGLERAGFETVAFCEFDKKAQLVLKKHWPDVPVYDDVRTLTYEHLQTDGLNVDVICGGFPCQDISLAGKGAGLDGERSGLWFEFHRLINEIRPKYAIIENVSALRSRGLDEVLRSLAEIGYDAEWHCIPASAVGAPHRRDRVWIAAYRNCDDGWNWSSSKPYQGKSWMESGCSSERQFEQQPSKTLADTQQSGLEGRLHWWANQERKGEHGYLGCCRSVHGQPIENWWSIEPRVGRVAHGVSGRVDRLKQLGNAVVPQIPELIGRAILEYEKKLSTGYPQTYPQAM